MYPDFQAYHLETMDDFYNFCQNLPYGWIDHQGNKHRGVNNSNEYFLQSPAEVLKNQIAICWDQTELQRAWFTMHGIPTETYFLYYYLSDNNCPSHSILVFYKDGQKDGKPYWFEPMFHNTEVYYSGIHSFDSITELLNNLRTKFIRNGQASGLLPKDFQLENLELHQYQQPTYGISDAEFYEHCRRGPKILLKP